MQELYRMIPKVDIFLKNETMTILIEQYGQTEVTDAVREELQRLRELAGILGQRLEERRGSRLEDQSKGNSQDKDIIGFQKNVRGLNRSVEDNLRKRRAQLFHHVINATGTVLHTNLGRAPLSCGQAEKLAEKMTGYSNLEYDLEKGTRGERSSHFEQLLTRLTGAEAAVAVNNNAAAVLLTLSALAKNREVVVSRGELIEIGGKFRIPEVVSQGGAILREVGTTNKTHREDYEEAVGEETAAILKVHTSNYRISGFTESVSVRELAGLGVPVIVDLGSGVLVNLEKFGITHEPTVQETVANGADLVCFSGDKLLGGPQAGIIVGKKELIDQIKVHPLMRAVRIDKFTAAALEMVLENYLNEEGEWISRIPALRMLSETTIQLGERAERLQKMLVRLMGRHIRRWEISVEGCMSEAGGGALPGEQLPSAAVVIASKGMRPQWERELGMAERGPWFTDNYGVAGLQEQLRLQEVPVIGRIAKDKLWLDVRTVFEEEIPILARMLAKAMGEIERSGGMDQE
ncbi:MAG: L-seryl-tRNA(Sec) selenium transferase [Lachnospiraceae bacterium]|nr:L-seryl-tRNA(Sec) selenium transferase [Lachnospiraceae bacterium]